jgi:hypothetical protein
MLYQARGSYEKEFASPYSLVSGLTALDRETRTDRTRQTTKGRAASLATSNIPWPRTAQLPAILAESPGPRSVVEPSASATRRTSPTSLS